MTQNENAQQDNDLEERGSPIRHNHYRRLLFQEDSGGGEKNNSYAQHV